MKNPGNKLFGILAAVPALTAAVGGIAFPRIYEGVFPEDFLPGTVPQDILTVLVCLVILVLSFEDLSRSPKKRIVLIGLLAALWYLYGIFTIERAYNLFYLFYLVTFAASFWAVIFHVSRFSWQSLSLPPGRRIFTVSACASIAIGLIFTFLWVSALIPLMIQKNRIEFMYSIYILDLAFIMPAFIVTAVQILRKKLIGLILNPAIMILGFFVIFPLGLIELAKPHYGLVRQSGPMMFSFLFSLLMLVLGILHLRGLKLETES